MTPRDSDDIGRSWLTAAGFFAIRGVSPFMVTWVGPLFAGLLFFWVAVELSLAGRALAAGVFLAACALSAHLVDLFSLAYSPAGFSTASLFITVAFGAYACLHPTPSLRGALWRALLGGCLFAVCVLSRSGALLTIVGPALAAAVLAHRVVTSWPRRLVFLAALLALLLLPYAAVRPPGFHEVWLGVWEGLGDFDRTHGHTFHDTEAKRVLAEAGIETPERQPIWWRGQAVEPVFREKTLASIRSDPAWFATILAKRAAATVTQWKLLPSRRASGLSFARSTHPQEGAMDTYYGLTATGDLFAFGRHEVEAPVPLLWLPLVLLAGAGALRGVPGRAARLEFGLVVILAFAALVLPVLVTTAGALETEAFLLVYLLAAAFVGARSAAAARLRSMRP